MARIEGYCSATSVAAGDSVGFHVYSEAGMFEYAVYRMGVERVHVASGSGTAAAHAIPVDADSMGCGWPESFQLAIPRSWWSGVYLLILRSGVDTGEISFVVRGAAPGAASPILVMIPASTAHAYNNWMGHSLYDVDYKVPSPISKVSLDRPGSIMVGAEFGRWEEKFIRWVEAGYRAEYCTSIDLHEDRALLSSYQLLVIVGHDEYWSREMRDHAASFVASGGNVAVLGGNTCFWQVRFEDNNRTMVCYKWNAKDDPLARTDRLTTMWDPWWHSPDPSVGLHQVGLPGVELPPNTLIGTGFRHGAFASAGNVPAVGYEAKFPEHWVFKDTGLAAGRCEFGSASQIVGYETDAAEFALHPESGLPEVTGSDGTPRNFAVLATAELHGENEGDKHGNATMGLFLNHGVVFNAATINWANGLANDPVVQQITRNVIDRLGRAGAGSPPIQNSEFQSLDGWVQERAGEYKVLSGGGAAPVTRSTAPLAAGALCIDATGDLIWVSQVLEYLHGHTFYQVSAWVKTSAPGAVIALQRTDPSWIDFAIAEHPGTGEWQLVSAIGKVDDAGSLFRARIRLQVAQSKAAFTRVKVTAL